MKIKDNTYYKPRANLIFYQSKDEEFKYYTLYIKNPAIRYKLPEDGLHLKSKNIKKRFFRIYNNFYIKLNTHSFNTTYNVI